jgi:hypothetical protein
MATWNQAMGRANKPRKTHARAGGANKAASAPRIDDEALSPNVPSEPSGNSECDQREGVAGQVLIPDDWVRGELLDVQRYTDGSFKVGRLWDPSPERELIEFPSAWAAQQFISWWYVRDASWPS